MRPFPGEANRTARKYLLTPEQWQWFDEVYPTNGNHDISRACGISFYCIRVWAQRRGLMKEEGFRSRYLKEVYAKERRRLYLGLPLRTKRRVDRYTDAQQTLRNSMSYIGYILGDPQEKMGERFVIYYDEDTVRHSNKEKNAIRLGFEIKPLPEE